MEEERCAAGTTCHRETIYLNNWMQNLTLILVLHYVFLVYRVEANQLAETAVQISLTTLDHPQIY